MASRQPNTQITTISRLATATYQTKKLLTIIIYPSVLALTYPPYDLKPAQYTKSYNFKEVSYNNFILYYQTNYPPDEIIY